MIQKLTYFSVATISMSVLMAKPLRAQQQPDPQQGQQPSAPIPAIRSPLAGAADNGDATQDSQTLTPDTRSLTGVEDLSLGTLPVTHSYWQPRVSIMGTVDSNPQYSTANSDWSTWTSLVGGVDVHHTSGASDLALSYTGGGMFSNGGQAQNGIIQELALTDRFTFRRSTLAVFEQLGYLPESSFGFAGTAGTGLPGTGGVGSGLGNGFTPGQTILTPRGQNLSSSTAVEFDTKLSPRASITFVGNYSLLHYFDEPLANYGDAVFQVGYNYQLSRKDTIAVSYSFSAFRYSNLDQSININTVQASYGRRVTGRLAFQIAAGPQFVSSTSPITASSSTAPPTSSSVSALYWTLSSSLQYQLRRASLGASYYHGVSGGSGLLAGAETDVASASIGSQVSRRLSVGWNVGYSRNKGFAAEGAPAQQAFSYWFTGVNLARPLSRTLDVFVNYQMQYQNENTVGCVGAGCSPNVIRNTIGFGLNFHKQPIPF